MHIEKLRIDAAGTTFTLPLQSSLTVIAGVGPLERRGLVTELVTALGSGRDGVHLDLRADSGLRFRLERPAGSPPRVIDQATDADLTERFRSPAGQVSILDRAGLSDRSARKAMRLTEADLTSRSQLEERVLRLAHIDQGRLWDVARKVTERDRELAEASEALGAGGDDPELMAEVEARQAELGEAQAHMERVRRISWLVGANAAAATIPLVLMVGVLAAAVAVAVAVAMTAYSAYAWWRMDRARRTVEETVRAAGQQSYLAFQINRVNGLLADDHLRKQLMRAAAYHRAATAEWQMLAGDVPVDWALQHRREIREAAARLRDTVGVSNPMAVRMSPEEEVTADLAHALLHRLGHLRELGAGGESFPLILDEPFPDVEPAVKADLLELLATSSAHQQIVLLTQDPETAAWARLEALSGRVGIVEPADAERGEPATTAHRRHAVA